MDQTPKGHPEVGSQRETEEGRTEPVPCASAQVGEPASLPDAWLNVYPRELFGQHQTTPVLVAWSGEDTARRNLGDGGTTHRYVALARVEEALRQHEEARQIIGADVGAGHLVIAAKRLVSERDTAREKLEGVASALGDPCCVEGVYDEARRIVSERETALRELSNVRASLKEAIAQRDATEHQCAGLVRERDDFRSAHTTAGEQILKLIAERDAVQAQLVDARLTNDRHCTERDEAQERVRALLAEREQRFRGFGVVALENRTPGKSGGVLLVGVPVDVPAGEEQSRAVELGAFGPLAALDFAADFVAAAVDAGATITDRAERDKFVAVLDTFAETVSDVADEVASKAHELNVAERKAAEPASTNAVGDLLSALFLGGLAIAGARAGMRAAQEAVHKPARDPNGRTVCTASLAWAGNDGINRTRVCMLLEGHDTGEHPTRHAAADGTRWGDAPQTARDGKTSLADVGASAE